MHVEPVPTAKMRVETLFRNTVASVTPAFVPTMMFMFPILCAMALPNLSMCEVLFFMPGCLAHMCRPVPSLVMSLLSAVLVRPLLLVRALFMPLRPIRLVSVRALCG